MREDEYEGLEPIPLSTIVNCRLDKLLQEMCKFADVLSRDRRFDEVIGGVHLVEARWQRRFKQKWFDIDKERLKAMKQYGSLRGMTLNPGDRTNQDAWLISDRSLDGHREGALRFKPGESVLSASGLESVMLIWALAGGLTCIVLIAMGLLGRLTDC